LAIGSANHAYYRSLKIPERKIFHVPYAVDNSRFMRDTALVSANRAALRHKYGLPAATTVVLYASKLIERKHPDTVVRAIATLRDAGHSVTLFMVGSGHMEGELRTLAAVSAAGAVVFGGFINQRELPEVFAISDIFVLPADNEPWGLVVNEVMSAGIPVIVSNQMGCAPDLVKNGVNGYVVPAGNVTALADAITPLLSDTIKRRQMGAASRSIIDQWGYEQCHQGLTSALTTVLHKSRR
jgi:glycosyltransferase involved in cell wall biosynthesis